MHWRYRIGDLQTELKCKEFSLQFSTWTWSGGYMHYKQCFCEITGIILWFICVCKLKQIVHSLELFSDNVFWNSNRKPKAWMDWAQGSSLIGECLLAGFVSSKVDAHWLIPIDISLFLFSLYYCSISWK